MESGTVVGNRVFIAENATVIGDVTLADDVNIWFGAVVRADRDTITGDRARTSRTTPSSTPR